jgi:class 3 adenylate cyclase
LTGSLLNKLKSWLLIFFLSLLPGAIFLVDWNPEGEKAYRDEVSRLEWFNKSEVNAEVLLKCSRLDFWQGFLARRFAEVLQNQIARGHSLEEAVEIAWKASKSLFFSEVSLQLFWGQADDWKIRHFGETVANSEYLMKKLFTEMVKNANQKSNELYSSTWEQRIKLLFGHMIFPDQFSSDLRSLPFSSLIKGEPYVVVWDFIKASFKNEIAGGFFFYFPDRFDRQQLPVKLIMANWNMVNVSGEVFPVLLPLSCDNDEIFIHPAIDRSSFRQSLLEFKRMHVQRITSPVPDLEEKTRLPGEKMGSAFFIGDKLVRLCPLDPVSGYLGMLVADQPATSTPLRQIIAEVYFSVAGIIWLLFLMRICIFRELPLVDLKLRVMTWFLAFAAFPAGLTVGAWSSLIQDFEAYRIDQIQKGLGDTLQSVESGFSLVDNRFVSVSSDYFTSPDFLVQLQTLNSSPKNSERLFDHLYRHFSKKEINLSGAIIVVKGGWYFQQHRSPSLQGKNAQIDAVASILDQFLARADKHGYERQRIPEDPSLQKYRVPVILNVSDLDVYDNFTALSNCFERATDLRTKRRDFLQYVKMVDIDAKPAALIIIFWELTEQFKTVFKNIMHNESLLFKRKWGLFPDLALYQNLKTGVEIVEKTGNSDGLVDLAAFPVNKVSYFFDGLQATVMMPSARFGDLRYVARVTTANIRLAVANEKGFIVFSVTLLLLIIVLGASWASIWISGPLRQFVERMRQLNSGKIPSNMSIVRNDELGVAASSLKSMTEWVVERERLVKFISPKVLQMIAGGNVFKAGAGARQEVTVLVSDIRSFTSISENFPPEQVFAMVNTHLRQMAKIIREHSGLIDRFVGDAVWAVFFTPGKKGNEQALAAAVQMYKTHREIVAARQENGDFSYRIGIGLYAGKVLAGVLGDASVRLDFSVVGDALHEAERLESLARDTAGTGIIFSENFREIAESLGLEFSELPENGVYEVSRLEN